MTEGWTDGRMDKLVNDKLLIDVGQMDNRLNKTRFKRNSIIEVYPTTNN